METSSTISRGQRIAWVVLALTLLGFGLWTLHEFLAALVWAGVLSIAIWPLYQRARRLWPPSGHGLILPTLFTLGIALVFVLPIVTAGLQAGREARGVLAWIESARETGLPVPDAIAHLPVFGDQASGWWRDNLSDPVAAHELLIRLKDPELALAGRHLGAAILHRVVIFGFCLMTLFFLLKDGDVSQNVDMMPGDTLIIPQTFF